jgi:hypothetical protein
MQPDDTLAFHPLARIFPPLDPAEFEALKADIRAHGLREPIMVFENKILDGIHRYKACLAVGVAPRFRDYEGGEPRLRARPEPAPAAPDDDPAGPGPGAAVVSS